MQMIKMELEENLKSINQAEVAYLNEISFFRLLTCEYSEDVLEVLKSSALMQQIPDKEFISKLLQTYKRM